MKTETPQQRFLKLVSAEKNWQTPKLKINMTPLVKEAILELGQALDQKRKPNIPNNDKIASAFADAFVHLFQYYLIDLQEPERARQLFLLCLFKSWPQHGVLVNAWTEGILPWNDCSDYIHQSQYWENEQGELM